MQNPFQSKQSRLIIALSSLAMLTACSAESKLAPLAGFGASPTLPAPSSTLLPTVNIAPAIGWSENATPVAAEGTQVNAFAKI